jgi:hypothetical protein
MIVKKKVENGNWSAVIPDGKAFEKRSNALLL